MLFSFPLVVANPRPDVPVRAQSNKTFAGLGHFADAPADEDRDVGALTKAANQGDADAQYNLGVAYHDGEGVPQDYAEAVRWWRKAAEQGNLMAQSNLGVAYEHGEGVPQDRREALRWWKKAASRGHAEAQFDLGIFYSGNEGPKRVERRLSAGTGKPPNRDMQRRRPS